MDRQIFDARSFLFLVGGGEECRPRNNSSGLPEKKVYPDSAMGVRLRGQWDSSLNLTSFPSDQGRALKESGQLQ